MLTRIFAVIQKSELRDSDDPSGQKLELQIVLCGGLMTNQNYRKFRDEKGQKNGIAVSD